MSGVRLVYALAIVNLIVLAADVVYNVFGGLLPMLR
jgi:hypothetical protein